MRRLLTLLLLAAVSAAGETPDLQGMIDRAIAAQAERLVIPPGRYRLAPRDRVHLTIQGAQDLEIVADGVELVCTETTRALNLLNCRNLTLRGLTIDYDPLPFTQGRLVAVSEDARTHTIELLAGYPGAETVKPVKYEIFDADSRELRTTTYFGIQTQALGERRLQVTKPPHYQPQDAREQSGDLIVIRAEHAPGGSIPHAVFVDQSENVTLSGVTLYASNSFGFFETHCSRTRYLGCRVDRRDTADLQERELPRLRSLNADAFHSKYATVGPIYRDCLARYMGDDGIAINGNYHFVLAAEGETLRIVGKLGREPELQVGDPVELVAFSGVRLPDARVTAVETGPGTLSDAETAFVSALKLNERLQRQLLETDVVTTLVLDRAVELGIGSLVAPANRLGNGFEVSNCTIGPNRSRGILVKASHGVIRDNTLIGNWGEAIKLAPEYWWFEAGSSSDVTIADNVIRGCRDAAIAVYAHGGNGQIAPAGAHRDIHILDNQIFASANPGIVVTSTTGLELDGNAIHDPAPELLVSWKRHHFGRADDPDRQIYLENVEER